MHVDKIDHDDGTGDQGMFECANNETEDTAPLTHWITTRLGKKLGDARKNGDLRGVDSFIDVRQISVSARGQSWRPQETSVFH